MAMIKHDKCQAYEEKIKALEQQVKEYQGFREAQTSKVRELEKEREEMKVALIEIDQSMEFYIGKKYVGPHARLIERLKSEKS
jgi:predicted RNase H-like nuclease (RuvC/YqgF family)